MVHVTWTSFSSEEIESVREKIKIKVAEAQDQNS